MNVKYFVLITLLPLVLVTNLHSNIYYSSSLNVPEGGGKHYGLIDNTYGVNTEEGKCIRRTSDNGYIILADAINPHYQTYWKNGYMLIKTNSSGVVEWINQSYLFLGSTWNSVVEKHDGGFYIVGNRKIDLSNTFASLIEVNEFGVGQGVYDFFSGKFTDIIATSDENYVLTGCHGHSPSSNKMAFKINSNFDTLWLHSYYEYYGQIGYEIQETYDDGFIIVSGTNGGTPTLEQALLKIDSDGDILWSSSIGGGTTVYQTHDSGFISSSLNGNQLYITKINQDGYYEWTKYFCEEITNGYDCYDLIQDPKDYSYLLVGSKDISGSNSDIIVLKANVFGDSIYAITLDGIILNDKDCANSIDFSVNGYVVTGKIYEDYNYNQITYESFDVFLWHLPKYMSSSNPYYWPVQKNPHPFLWTHQEGWNNDDECIFIDENPEGNYHVSVLTRRNAGLAFVEEEEFYPIVEYDSSIFDNINCIEDYNNGLLLAGNYYNEDNFNYNGVVRLLDNQYNIIHSSSIPYFISPKTYSSSINKFIKTVDNTYIAVGQRNNYCWYGKFVIEDNQIEWLWSNILDQGELLSIVEDFVEYDDTTYISIGKTNNGPVAYRFNKNGGLIEIYEYQYYLGNNICLYDIVLSEPYDGSFFIIGGNDSSTIVGKFYNHDNGWINTYNENEMPWIKSFKSLFIDDNENILVGGNGIDPLIEENIAIVVKFDQSDGSIIDIIAPFGYLYNDFQNESGLGYIVKSNIDNGYMCGGWIYNWVYPRKQLAFSKYGYDGDMIYNDNLKTQYNPSQTSILESKIFLSSSIIKNHQNVEISFILNFQSYVKIDVYNILGQRVKNLLNEEHNTGYHSILWDTKDNMNNIVSNGTYFIRYQDDINTIVKPLKIISH